MKKLTIVVIVCTLFGSGLSFAGDVPIDLGTCVNRSAKTPWSNQVPYGYREWLPKEIIFKETVFQLSVNLKRYIASISLSETYE